MQFTLFGAGALEVLLRVQFDPVQIIVIQGQAAEGRIDSRSQLFDCRLIKTAQFRAPVGIGARLPAGVVDHAAVLAAHRQH